MVVLTVFCLFSDQRASYIQLFFQQLNRFTHFVILVEARTIGSYINVINRQYGFTIG